MLPNQHFENGLGDIISIEDFCSATRALSREQRVVIDYLYGFKGLEDRQKSHEEVARITSMTAGRVRALERSALRLMRSWLSHPGAVVGKCIVRPGSETQEGFRALAIKRRAC